MKVCKINWCLTEPLIYQLLKLFCIQKRCIYLCYGLETKGLKNITKKYSGILSDKTINDKLMSTPNYDKQNYATVEYNDWSKSFYTASLYNQIKKEFV